MLADTLVVAQSSNTKLGNMPASYRTLTTCPESCPFLPTNKGGCYGGGRLFGLAKKHARDIAEDDALKILKGARQDAKYLRDRVVGDVVAPDGSFDLPYVLTIARIAEKSGVRAFGYTHHYRAMSPEDVQAVADSGYIMNASTETREDIEQAVALGLPTTVTGNSWTEGEVVAGRRITTCPAQTRNDVTCSSCGLCAKPERACTVRFLLHGPTRQAAAAIEQRLAAA